jgi:hypothetical protein
MTNLRYVNSPPDDDMARTQRQEMSQEAGREAYWAWVAHDQKREDERPVQPPAKRVRRIIRRRSTQPESTRV